MKLRIVLTLLATMSLGAVAQSEHERAIQMYRQGQFQDALVVLDESIAAHPDWYFPILLKGQCNLKLDNYEAALNNFNDALTLEIPSKDVPKVKYYIARTYMSMKDFLKASHAFNELLSMVPDSRKFDIYLNRGQCEMQVAIAAEGTNSNQARSYFSKAVVSFADALKYDAPNIDLEVEAAFQKAFAQYKIGNLQGGIQSLEKSISAFQDVIRRNPKEERAHKFLIDLSFQLASKSNNEAKIDRYNETVRYIDRYLAIWPDAPQMLNKKGQALQGAERYADAVSVFTKAANKLPNDGTVFFSLASCQMADKKYNAAINSFQKAMTKGENANPNVYSYMAYCYQQQKTGCENQDVALYEKAVNVLEKGLKSVSGRGKDALQKDLENKRNNLEIIRNNVATENQNHKVALDNVRNLAKTLQANRQRLARNREMYIQQPTAELKEAIEETQKVISDDEKALSEQLDLLKTYVANAKKCGGGRDFTHYNDMVSALNTY